MPIGIDFLHVVEFSRYECAPVTAISHRLQGRPPNLVEGTRKSKSGKSFIVLGNSHRCLALYTPVLKGFSSNSQARGKDSLSLSEGQIPHPLKRSKWPILHARLITLEIVTFGAQVVPKSLSEVKIELR